MHMGNSNAKELGSFQNIFYNEPLHFLAITCMQAQQGFILVKMWHLYVKQEISMPVRSEVIVCTVLIQNLTQPS